MAQLKCYNVKGKEIGQFEVSSSLADAPLTSGMAHQVVVGQLAAKRQGNAESKTRAQVAGSTAKPWRQKGTGRARAGRKQSPIWRGGGTAFGPHKRSYRQRIPVKMRHAVMRGFIAGKVAKDSLLVVEDFKLDEYKTKNVASMLKAMEISGKILLITAEADADLLRASSNIPHVSQTFVDVLNPIDLAGKNTVIASKVAIEKLEARLK
ncbi:50S ribosomal protein L4 [Candidatus Hydrogenedentota bacterium]